MAQETVNQAAKTFLEEKPKLEVYREAADQTIDETVKAIQDRLKKEVELKHTL